MTLLIRYISTCVLVYMIYQETGFATALSIFLIFVTIECQVWINKNIIQSINEALDDMKDLWKKNG